MARKTTCNECKGTGEVGEFTTYSGESSTRCPWCEGTGKVDVSYVVYGHGWNGDWSFSECYDVVNTLGQAKRLCERYMLKDRFNNVLEDGTPTLQWMEIFGPGIEESLGCEVNDGRLVWSEP